MGHAGGTTGQEYSPAAGAEIQGLGVRAGGGGAPREGQSGAMVSAHCSRKASALTNPNGEPGPPDFVNGVAFVDGSAKPKVETHAPWFVLVLFGAVPVLLLTLLATDLGRTTTK